MGIQMNRVCPSTVWIEFHSLFDAVNSKSIADDFEIETYSTKHDFENDLKVAILKQSSHPIRLPNSLRKPLSTTS